MRVYRGERTQDGCKVVVDDLPGGPSQPNRIAILSQNRPLNPRFDLRKHSPTGFEWGYGGSGPAQLALAILADLKGPEFAEQHYQDFKFKVIGGISGDKFQITEEEIEKALAA